MLSSYRGNANAVAPATSGKPILVSLDSQPIGRIVVAPDGTSITPNADTTDIVEQVNTQAAGTLTINAPTGTPSDGQRLLFRLKCTNSQALSFNAIYRGSSQLPLPASTTGSSKYDYLTFMYNADATKWDLLGANFGF